MQVLLMKGSKDTDKGDDNSDILLVKGTQTEVLQILSWLGAKKDEAKSKAHCETQNRSKASKKETRVKQKSPETSETPEQTASDAQVQYDKDQKLKVGKRGKSYRGNHRRKKSKKRRH